MADPKAFEVVPWEQISPARPAGRGRARDTYFEEIGLLDALRENIDGAGIAILRDREGDMPTGTSEAEKKRRQSAQTKLRRSLQAQEWFANDKSLRPAFRVRPHAGKEVTGSAVLFVRLERLSADELQKRGEAAKKRQEARAK